MPYKDHTVVGRNSSRCLLLSGMHEMRATWCCSLYMVCMECAYRCTPRTMFHNVQTLIIQLTEGIPAGVCYSLVGLCMVCAPHGVANIYGVHAWYVPTGIQVHSMYHVSSYRGGHAEQNQHYTMITYLNRSQDEIECILQELGVRYVLK